MILSSSEAQEVLHKGQLREGMARSTEYNLGGVWAIVSFVVVFSAGMSLLPAETVNYLFKENGIIETASVVGHLVACGWLFYTGLRGNHKPSLLTGLFILLLGLRELDFHSRFTTIGIFRTKFFISPDVPLIEKTVGTVIVALLAYAIITYCRQNYSLFIKSLRAGKAWAFNTSLAIAFMVLSKWLDSGPDSLEWIISLIHRDPVMCMWIFEEVMEMAIPALILLAIFQYRHTKN